MKVTTLLFFIAVSLFTGFQGNCADGLASDPVASNNQDHVTSLQRPHWYAREIQFQGAKDTNGLACNIHVSNFAKWTSMQPPPVCYVSITNTFAKPIRCWGGFYGETYSEIELSDSTGSLVAKTAIGKTTGIRADENKIKDMVKARFKQWVDGKARTPGYALIQPGQSCIFGFSIPKLFEITKAGQYALKVRTCMIQKVGGEEYDPDLKIFWLPEVSVKIQILSLSATGN